MNCSICTAKSGQNLSSVFVGPLGEYYCKKCFLKWRNSLQTEE